MHITDLLGSFTVDDIPQAKAFYGSVLELEVSDALSGGNGPLWLGVENQRRALIYHKPGHEPSEFTVLNIAVADIEATVDALTERGVEFLRYPDVPQDERGILHGPGHSIAWLTDPSGNSLAVVQLSDG